MKKASLSSSGKLYVISGIVLLLSAKPATTQPANTPWPQFHQNQWNTGYQSQYAWPVGATVG